MEGGWSQVALSVLRKAVSIALAIWLLLSINFLAFYVQLGDPTEWMWPRIPGNEEVIQRIIDEARLDESLIVQYVDYMVDTVTGGFRIATSFWRGADIQDFIWRYAGRTAALLTLSLVGSLALGAAIEVAAGRRLGGLRSGLAHGLSLIAMSIPVSALAITTILVNAEFDLGFPFRGMGIPYTGEEGAQFLDVARAMVLPVLTVTVPCAGLAALMLREGRRRSADGAPPKGTWISSLSSGLAMMRPFLHFYVAWTMAAVLAVEVIFDFAGLGFLMWNAVYNMDTPLLMAALTLMVLMTMAASSVTSLFIHLLGDRRPSEVLRDWGRREPVETHDRAAAPPADVALKAWARSAWRSFKSSAAGVSAAILMGVILVLGALGPFIAPYPDLTDYSPERSTPPSPEHLLGTDAYGRDVLSLWLFGARDAAVTVAFLVLTTVLVGFAIGLVAWKTTGLGRRTPRAADFLLTAGARAMVAIPLPVFAATRMYLTRLFEYASEFMVLAFYAWAWVLIARPVRAETRAAGSRARGSQMLPRLLAGALSVAKFAVPLIIVATVVLAFFGFSVYYDYSWADLLESAYRYSAFSLGQWYLILPPIVGIVLVCGGAFVLLDRVEQAVRAGSLPVAPGGG
mgnify:FL=1